MIRSLAVVKLTTADTDAVERPGGLTVVAIGTADRYAYGITGAKGFAGRYVEVTITAVAAAVV